LLFCREKKPQHEFHSCRRLFPVIVYQCLTMINLLIIAFCLHSELKTKQKDGIYLMPLKAGIYIVITDACHLHTQMGGQVLSGWFGVVVTALVTSTKLSYCTLSPVSTGIGDDLWRVYHPDIYPGHSGPLSLATHLCV